MNEEFTVIFPFCGLGAGASGFLEAGTSLFGREAKFRSVGGIDNDPVACANFEYLTGSRALCADISKLTPAELRDFAGPEAPHCVFTSSPCVGSSGLISEAKAKEERYQALNRLAFDWLELQLTTWDRPPSLMLFENVPRIVVRAKDVVRKLKSELKKAGYVMHDGFHECGELGGLAQLRRRWLLVARQPDRCPPLLYTPPKKRVRGCGEVLGSLPMPGDPTAGPMHELPKIGMLNWIRLAMIPAGGDWRDLPGVLPEGAQRRSLFKRHEVAKWEEPTGVISGAGSNAVENVADPRVESAYPTCYGVKGWEQPSPTVTGQGRIGGGAFSVADPRLQLRLDGNAHTNLYNVRSWDQPTKTIIGATRVGSGAQAVADPRPFGNVNRVTSWSEPIGTVTHSPAPSSGAAAVADPRVDDELFRGRLGVVPWDEPAGVVTGAGRPQNGRFSVADPRKAWFGGVLGVVPWSDPSKTIAGESLPANGPFAVADPRLIPYDDKALEWTAQKGGAAYGVRAWDQSSFTVTGGATPGQGGYSIADPRVEATRMVGPIPLAEAKKMVTLSRADAEPGAWAVVDADGNALLTVKDVQKAPSAVPVIVADDGTWHRPMTTLELAALQGLPSIHRGAPLRLAGSGHSSWRKQIGNAVPVGTAKAIAEQMLVTLLSASAGMFMLSGVGGVWVSPENGRMLHACDDVVADPEGDELRGRDAVVDFLEPARDDEEAMVLQ